MTKFSGAFPQRLGGGQKNFSMLVQELPTYRHNYCKMLEVANNKIFQSQLPLIVHSRFSPFLHLWRKTCQAQWHLILKLFYYSVRFDIFYSFLLDVTPISLLIYVTDPQATRTNNFVFALFALKFSRLIMLHKVLCQTIENKQFSLSFTTKFSFTFETKKKHCRNDNGFTGIDDGKGMAGPGSSLYYLFLLWARMRYRWTTNPRLTNL
jgi:hypothetical protein